MNRMGKCKFAASWLEMPDFKEWLQPVEGNVREAYCTLCKKKISIVSMGINSLKSHMCCASHKAAASRRDRQLSIASFCGNRVAPPQPSANVVTPPAVAPEATATTRAISASSSSAADIRVALGSTATLRAEVLWCLHTAEKHHSLNSNENVAEVFKAVSRFGYSKIVHLWQGQNWIHHTIRVSTTLQAGAHQHHQQVWPVCFNV